MYVKIILLLLMPLMLISCSRPYEYKRDYRIASDGLFYYRDSKKLFSGMIKDSAEVILEYKVKDGKKNGSFSAYYKNGIIMQSGYLAENKNVGEWKYYYPDGRLECEGKFINDYPDGEWKFYFQDGALKTWGSYHAGLKHGSWIYCNDTGKITEIIYFQYGKLIDTRIIKT